MLANAVYRTRHRTGAYDRIDGLEHIDKVIIIDQSPIGRTPRSNPATYTGLWDDVRELFAPMPDAKLPRLPAGPLLVQRAGRTVRGVQGRRPIKIEMHFLPDVYVQCEVCGGDAVQRRDAAGHATKARTSTKCST